MKAMMFLLLSALSIPAFAGGGSGESTNAVLGLITSPLAIFAVVFFAFAYALVIAEEFIHMRKSKPVLLAAGVIWLIVAILGNQVENGQAIISSALDHNLLEYAELLLFLLVAMVYVNALTERNVFEALRAFLVSKGLSYRALFWITGALAFVISPIADNLTTALLMGAVVLAVGSDRPKFVSIAFINIVVAANAGGAFSPFGDITTLMVWQSGHVEAIEFLALLIPSLINFIVPAAIMSFAIPKETPTALDEVIKVKRGGYIIIFLFLATIATAITFKQVLHLKPFLGMMTGLSYLFLYSYILKSADKRMSANITQFDIFNKVAKAEWDTLLFFFGVIFCVGGLGTIGYLAQVSDIMYNGWGATTANIVAGLLSAVVDNIPVMFAILSMNPEMGHEQWLLVTLTAGVGGSLLSVGSAAGVALMGQSKGLYTFFGHLKWSWAVGLGYIASIYVHMLINF